MRRMGAIIGSLFRAIKKPFEVTDEDRARTEAMRTPEGELRWIEEHRCTHFLGIETTHYRELKQACEERKQRSQA